MRANEHFHTSEELRVNRELRLVWKFLVKLNKEGYYPKTEGFWLNMSARNAKKASEMPNLVEIPMRKIGE